MPCASALYCIGVDLLHSKLCIMVFSSLENINLVLYSEYSAFCENFLYFMHTILMHFWKSKVQIRVCFWNYLGQEYCKNYQSAIILHYLFILSHQNLGVLKENLSKLCGSPFGS